MVTMSILALIGYIAGAVGFIATLASALVVVRSSATKQTVESQKELIDTLLQDKELKSGQIADLQQKHLDSTKAIASLQGKVDVLKDIPLKEISTNLKQITSDQQTIASEVTKCAETQEAILQQLKPATT